MTEDAGGTEEQDWEEGSRGPDTTGLRASEEQANAVLP